MKMTLTPKHYRLILVAFFLFTIWGFTKPGSGAGIAIPHFDKVMHFGVFFLLALLLDTSRFTTPLFIIVVLTAYGISIELYQDTLASRQASLADVIADVIGVLTYFWPCRQPIKTLLKA